ncbi:hypothetical protein D3C78_1066020 [compost metagenome]
MGIEKEDIAVTATTMTKKGLTMPACTAASPMIRPPTMPIAGPIGLGRRIPASRNTSIEISRIKTSIMDGNGTPCRESMIVIASSVGSNPGWKEINETYNAGAIRAINAAQNRNMRINVPGIHRS